MTLLSQILDFIANPKPPELEKLALNAFAAQFERIDPYRAYCASLGVSPATVHTLLDIPVVSTAAFKHVILCRGPDRAERIFVTSGTSRGKTTRGRHFIANLALYRASALAHMRRMLFADGRRLPLLTLHPTADRMPYSSLSQMLTWAFETFGAAPSLCCATPRGVDIEAAAGFLIDTERNGWPVGILGTTAALAALFDFLRASGTTLRLAPGSRLMDTGGAKGQAVPMTSDDVLAAAQEYLGIVPKLAINEYGMTELCSQLYDATAFNAPHLHLQGPRVKLAPPWLHVSARDPVTMRPVPPGEPGLLCFFDLANAGSVCALMTEDLGTVMADGTVLIHGRALAAEPRGCALGIEQFGSFGGAASDGPADGWARQNDNRQATSAEELEEIGSRITRAARDGDFRRRTAAALAEACSLWRQSDYRPKREAIVAIAQTTGQNEQLLDASLDALLARFERANLLAMAAAPATGVRLIGFIMPGNVLGAGLHELVQALIAGADAIVKPATAEPFFFPAFARTLAQIDSRVAQHLAVVNWNRSQADRTAALARACDAVAAFGNNQTIATLTASIGAKLIDFGARLSIGIVAREALADDRLSAAIAGDVSLFDQRGCLSMHHLFIESEASQARVLARCIALQLEDYCRTLPPASPAISEAASARAVREDARWRMLGNDGVELWSSCDGLQWTVLFDPACGVSASPLCRTLRISSFTNLDDLEARLNSGPALEGVALADPIHRLARLEPILRRMGASYFCAPGELQSPPPDWPHGGGRFLARLAGDRD